MFTYLTPVFGVVLSAAVLGEAVGMTVISGGGCRRWKTRTHKLQMNFVVV
jgi:hypothetical protein